MSICSICVCILTHKCTQRGGEGGERKREEETGRGEIEREKMEKGRRDRSYCAQMFI